MRMGDYAADRGDWDTAIGMYQRAHSAAPGDPVPLHRLGAALSQVGAYDESASAYQSLLQLDPANREAQRGLANTLIALGRPDQAIPLLESSLASGSDPRTHNSLGVAYDLLARHADAQTQYREGLVGAPNDLDMRTNLALSESLSGDTQQAIDRMRSTAYAQGATVRHRYALALVYGLGGYVEEAAEVARSDFSDDEVVRLLQRFDELRQIQDTGRRAAAIGSDVARLAA